MHLLLCRGDFRSFDKGELDDMRDAADRQAAKAERKLARNDPKVRTFPKG